MLGAPFFINFFFYIFYSLFGAMWNIFHLGDKWNGEEFFTCVVKIPFCSSYKKWRLHKYAVSWENKQVECQIVKILITKIFLILN